MRAHARGGEVLCRIGGEEFISIHPACDLEHALVLADRLRRAIASNEIEYPGFDRRVTASLGVSQKAPWMTSSDDLLKTADQALYRAKAQGRNAVVAFRNPEDWPPVGLSRPGR